MKVGMLAVYDDWGKRWPCTVLHLDDCRVVQVKTLETDGYSALQLGVGEAKTRRVGITAMGHFNKAEVVPKRKLWEFRISPDMIVPMGTQIRARHFVPGQLVDVCGYSKGKGTQGAMKLWGFGGGRATHGNSLAHRVLGSTGQRQDPGRTFKGKKMPGKMGNERITTQNVKVIKVDPKRELVYVYGSVPGTPGTFCRITDAVKGPFYPSPPPMPTYVFTPSSPGEEEDLSEILIPKGEVDALKGVEHPNPIQY